MSLLSYSTCWMHIVFSTHECQKIITPELRPLLSKYFTEYCREKRICQKINYVNPEHVHLLIDLPTNTTIEEVIRLIKGSSSHWINQQNIIRGKFYWERGYGILSVSPSIVHVTERYIACQEEHHMRNTFQSEYDRFVKCYEEKKASD